jgi:hypothetical protein
MMIRRDVIDLFGCVAHLEAIGLALIDVQRLEHSSLLAGESRRLLPSAQ